MRANLSDYLKIGAMILTIAGSVAVTRSQVADLRVQVEKLDQDGSRGAVQSIEALRGETRVLGAKIDALHLLVERDRTDRRRR